ncbi:hypothetical protein [Cellulomonas sp. URHB0016]
MTTATTDEPYAPNIPTAVRKAVYYATLLVGTLAVLASGLAQIYWPEQAAVVLATGGVVTTTMAFLAGGLGVAYVAKQ